MTRTTETENTATHIGSEDVPMRELNDVLPGSLVLTTRRLGTRRT
jgi:hypothetical protein